ncbi:MAG TPA: ferrous iron transport protein B [Verrucomicrobiota bacterium]|nr:ferrous iron transport protein B [Verrucomicrobiales bacterium]HRI16394.1 ferrous iron transport protein B [Verrucomicrobiota bacterium]
MPEHVPNVSQPLRRSTGASATFTAVLTGNPNCGKTTLFNALTGLRARVGNYAGVTVERKEGAMVGADPEYPVTLLDLPGTYSLSPQSLDEQIARDVLFRRLKDVPEPDLIIVVVDASNLQRNLYYATQVIELGYPTLVALNMMDVAQANGQELDLKGLSAALGVPVFPLVASAGTGVNGLRDAVNDAARSNRFPESSLTSKATDQLGHTYEPRSFAELPETFGREAQALEARLERLFPHRERLASAEALLVLSDDKVLNAHRELYPAEIADAVAAARSRLEAAGVDWRSAAIEARYARVFAIAQHVTTETTIPGDTMSDKLDRVLTHRVWGLLIFVGIMALMFQSIFTFATIPMDAIKKAVNWCAGTVTQLLGAGDLQDLIANGVIQGVGAVIVFLPQICLLFLFIALLEDTGYMARAAFLMDRLMSRVGLHGKSFIPMLSSFACAIPGIMATRTIESPKDRLVTILVAPLMSCSARLPVYTVLIAACIPPTQLFGFVGLPGLTLLGMYLLGIVGALGMAWLFKRTLLRGEPPPLILELPPYKRPVTKVILRHMWDRSKLFLRRAGTVILGINILLWFLATYPRNPAVDAGIDARRVAAAQAMLPEIRSAEEALRKIPEVRAQPAFKQLVEQFEALDKEQAGEHLRQSFAGRLGHGVEPLIRPLGFDWKIGIGIVASFAAREVFVSTMSVVYNVGKVDTGDSASTASLVETLKSETWADGTPVYTTLTGVTLMVFYVFAMQCVSTIAIVRRETNGWKWPLFQLAYMTALAWIAAWVTYQGGRLLGFV